MAKISSRLKVKYNCGSIELKVEKELLFWHLSAFARKVEMDLRCIRQTFLEHLTTFLQFE